MSWTPESKEPLRLLKKGDLDLWIASDLIDNDILVAFTTRCSGKSEQPFASLNLGFNVNDDPELVKENRKIVASALNFDPTRLTLAKQVHGSGVRIVTDEMVGSGSLSLDTAVDDTDALVTNEFNLPIAVLTADCVPIVIVEPKKKLVAVVHAGWRGTLDTIVINVVDKLRAEFEVDPQHLRAFLGPSIRACSYEASDEQHKAFTAKFPEIIGDEKVLDLSIINVHQMIKAGLNSDNIFDLTLCTFCNEESFFSYRRDQKTGRQAAIAMIIDR